MGSFAQAVFRDPAPKSLPHKGLSFAPEIGVPHGGAKWAQLCAHGNARRALFAADSGALGRKTTRINVDFRRVALGCLEFSKSVFIQKILDGERMNISDREAKVNRYFEPR